MQLLSLIGNLGFVNRNQLDMIWSTCTGYPTKFASSILSNWASFGGLIKVSVNSKETKNALNRTVYSLTNNGKQFLIDNGIWTEDYKTDKPISLNNHNEQTIEVIVQGLYAAMFKYRTYEGDLCDSLETHRRCQHGTYKAPLDNNYSELTDGAVSLHGKGIRRTVPRLPMAKGTVTGHSTDQQQDTGRHTGVPKWYTVSPNTVSPVADTVAGNSKEMQPSFWTIRNGEDAIACPANWLQTQDQLISSGKNQAMVTTNLMTALRLGIVYPIAVKDRTTSPTPNHTHADSSITIPNSYLTEINRNQLPLPYLGYASISNSLIPTLVSFAITSPNWWTKLLSNTQISATNHLTNRVNLMGNAWNGGAPLNDNRSFFASHDPFAITGDPVRQLDRNKFTSTHQGQDDSQLVESPIIPLVQSYLENQIWPTVSLAVCLILSTHLTSLIDFPRLLIRLYCDLITYNNDHLMIKRVTRTPWSLLTINYHLLQGRTDDESLKTKIGDGHSSKDPAKGSALLASNQETEWQPSAELVQALRVGMTRIRKAQAGKTKVPTNAALRNPVTFNHHFLSGKDAQLERSLSLISNPNFHLDDYNFASFNHQFGNQYGQDNELPFVADAMISFTHHGRKQKLFVELDNRTETNATQVQKILNYTWFALTHPDIDIEMLIVTTDGALRSRRLNHYTNVNRRLCNLAAKASETVVNAQGHRVLLTDLYRQATNLKVTLTGVSEAHVDIAQFLLGSNYLPVYRDEIKRFTKEVNNHSDWNATFTPSSKLKAVMSSQDLNRGTSINSLSHAPLRPHCKGILRYVDPSISITDQNWGWITFKHKWANASYRQPVLFGQEHELDTIFSIAELCQQAKQAHRKLDESMNNYPIVFYPTRERILSSLSLPSFKGLLDWGPDYNFAQPLYIQPQWSMMDNPQLMAEMRWLTIQYAQSIFNYYDYGYVNLTAKRHHEEYDDRFLSYSPARTYQALHTLTKKLNATAFNNQLRLSEVPTDIAKLLFSRWPKGCFSIPQLLDLPYWNSEIESAQNRAKLTNQFTDFLVSPNAVTITSRIHPQI